MSPDFHEGHLSAYLHMKGRSTYWLSVLLVEFEVDRISFLSGCEYSTTTTRTVFRELKLACSKLKAHLFQVMADFDKSQEQRKRPKRDWLSCISLKRRPYHLWFKLYEGIVWIKVSTVPLVIGACISWKMAWTWQQFDFSYLSVAREKLHDYSPLEEKQKWEDRVLYIILLLWRLDEDLLVDIIPRLARLRSRTHGT